MKNLIFILLLFSTTTFADTWVNGYTRSDGTYVQGHYRSNPNQYRNDNYSSKGNQNPYTGKKGYAPNEYSNPPVYNDPPKRGSTYRRRKYQ